MKLISDRHAGAINQDTEIEEEENNGIEKVIEADLFLWLYDLEPPFGSYPDDLTTNPLALRESTTKIN